MNTMSVPGFTAETSLYKSSGHYQTGRQMINFAAGTVMPQEMPQTGGRILCTAGGCSCNSEERCNAMFSEPGLCGDNASCNEKACHCSLARRESLTPFSPKLPATRTSWLISL
jgi:hypothetical protein